ncbi:MAG: DUF502 domain-containing protein [Longimicrobiales bacterium]
MKRRPLVRAFKRHLIAGLIVITPVTVTGAVLWWVFQRVDGLLGRFLYPALGMRVPGLGLVALILLLLGIGWVAERALGSRIVHWWHGLLERIPVARRVYSAANRIIRTVLSQQERPFSEVVMLEYPGPGRWSIGFIAARAPDAVQQGTDERVSVFIPNTPNVATGRLVIVARSMVRPIDLTVDQVFTFALSAGSVTPANVAAHNTAERSNP